MPAEEVEVELVVGGGIEGFLAVVAALGEVIPVAGRGEAGFAGHGAQRSSVRRGGRFSEEVT